MDQLRRVSALSAAIALSLLLTACGGGGGNNGSNNLPALPPPLPLNTQNATTALVAPGDAIAASVLVNDTATDGFNQFNYRRQQIGLAAFSRNNKIDAAANGHSNYQKVNDTISHEQIAGKPAFTGIKVSDRLNAAQYYFTSNNGYAYGEVISASGNLAGTSNAEDLITAIYHRFVIFEPKFREAGAGSAGFSATGYNFFTVDFAADGYSGTGGIGTAQIALYPYANQTGITTVFQHKQETPDPVPDQPQTFVGYPVSVHADIDTTVTVSSFTIAPRGGQVLPVRLLSYATDVSKETPASAAAIVPLSQLAAATTYDVQFIGFVSGLPVARAWSFTTR